MTTRRDNAPQGFVLLVGQQRQLLNIRGHVAISVSSHRAFDEHATDGVHC